jgi:hypothetical protein
MQAFLANPGLIAAIVGGLLLLLVIAVAPENLSNVVGELFQLVGRLVTGLASEAEAGAEALFGIVRGVFTFHKTGTTKPTPTPGARQTDSAQPSSSSSAATTTQAPPAQGTPSAGGQEEEETPFAWVAETIFIRLLYLATVVVIVVSDFIFAILRLQAVLFPSLPAPTQDLSRLSLLTGALLVSIVLLSGALTLDFFNVLPPPARLFPNLAPGKRRLLLVISILSFVLSIVVVGALFLEGQLLISLAATSPAGAIALATLIGVLQVLVVFIGAWGAVRGLAIILALLGGIVGIVLHLVALLLRWVGDAFDVIGTSVIPELIFGIAAIFGHRRERPARPSSVSNVLSIVGYGDRSSAFTALLCEDVLGMYGRAGLLAAGVYAEEPAVRDTVRRRLGQLGVNNISPVANNDHDPLNSLRTHVLRAYQRKGESNKLLLWVVDGEQAVRCASTLSDLKREMHDLSIAVVCLLPPGGVRGASPYPVLEKLATHKESATVEPAISTTILVDDQSPLYKIYGEPIADHMVARSLSGMLLAPLHNPSNPSFVAVTRSINQAGFVFSALAADSKGIVTSSASGGAAGRPAAGSGSVAPEQALARAQVITEELLKNPSTVTYDARPTADEPSLYLNFVVPISASSPEFVTFRGQISHFLAEHSIYLYSVTDGDGIDLSEREPSAKGDRYTQVGLLYGVKAPARS